MPIVNPDFSQEVSPNTPGTYLCVIADAELKRGNKTGTQYLNWKLLTFPEKKTVFHSTPIEGKGAGMFKHFVHAAGFKDYEGGSIDTNMILGKFISMDLTIDEKKYFVVKDVAPQSDAQKLTYKSFMSQKTNQVPAQSFTHDDIPL